MYCDTHTHTGVVKVLKWMYKYYKVCANITHSIKITNHSFKMLTHAQ